MTLRKDKMLPKYMRTLDGAPKGQNLTKIYEYTR